MPLGSENEIEDEDDDDSAPLRVTFHVAPEGRPVSVNVTVYVTRLNVIPIFTFAPFTVMVPEDCDVVYPLTEPIEYEYVPFGTENVIVFAAENSVVPFSVTDHGVPDGNPFSVNVTVYVFTGTGVNVTAIFTFAPFTVMVPEDGDAVYPVTEATT